MNRKRTPESDWLPFSDLMTGLMVIFMFIAIAYMLQVQQEQAERDEIFSEFQAVKESLYTELDSVFRDDFSQWEVVLDKDLSIKFTNPDILFASGQARIRTHFRRILDEFLPRYFDVLLQEKYKGKILEVRIEGHTDTTPAIAYDRDPYIGNVLLSQLRSAEVLAYFRKMRYYKSLDEDDELRLQYWLTANGLSYGRTLDANKTLTADSGLPVDAQLSRRVEFRIRTNSDAVVAAALAKMQE